MSHLHFHMSFEVEDQIANVSPHRIKITRLIDEEFMKPRRGTRMSFSLICPGKIHHINI